MDHQPLVAVHLVVLRQAVCHDCGWQGDLHHFQGDAEMEARRHEDSRCRR